MTYTIIGKGGFGKEVRAYLQKIGHAVFEMATTEDYTPDAPVFGHILAIGDPDGRKRALGKMPFHLTYPRILLSEQYGPFVAGDGTIVCPSVLLTTDIALGRFVIVNIGATIGHDCEIGDFVTISPGANLSGNVKIGDLCHIGSGAVIREGITICDGVTVGAGAVVVKDIAEPGTYLGVPAKKQTHWPDLRA